MLQGDSVVTYLSTHPPSDPLPACPPLTYLPIVSAQLTLTHTPTSSSVRPTAHPLFRLPAARLLACPPARLPACPPARLPACPPARPSSRPSSRPPTCTTAGHPACSPGCPPAGPPVRRARRSGGPAGPAGPPVRRARPPASKPACPPVSLNLPACHLLGQIARLNGYMPVQPVTHPHIDVHTCKHCTLLLHKHASIQHLWWALNQWAQWPACKNSSQRV